MKASRNLPWYSHVCAREDYAGRKIDGDDLLDCITGKKTITNDLQAK